MKVRNERERRWNVERFTDAHERTGEKQTIVSFHMARRPRDERPDEETAADREAAAETIRDVTAERTEEGIDPFKLAEHSSPVLIRTDAGNVRHDGELHCREHLAVEVIQ